MGSCNTSTNCNPCGPDFNAFNQLATRAGAYARQANTSAVDAANSAQDAQNAWLEFNALYLGAFAVAPSVDNEGNPLQEGALYWNSVSNELFAWNGSTWGATNFNEFTPFLATGTTFARNLVTREADVANVLDFGAVGDGVADDTAAIQAAIDAATNIYFPSGTYLVSESITITTSNTHIDLGNATVSTTAGYSDWSTNNGRTAVNDGRYRGVFNFIGSDVLDTTVTDATISGGSSEVTLASVTGVTVGDIVHLRSAETWYSTAVKEDVLRISKISGNVITLDRPTQQFYDSTTYIVNAKIVRPIQDCSIRGGNVLGIGLVDGSLLNGFGPCGITFNAAFNCRVENVNVKYFQNTQIFFTWVLDSIASNIFMTGLEDSVDQDSLNKLDAGGLVAFYGLSVNRCNGITINNVTGSRVRHLTDGFVSFNVHVTNCMATRTTTSAYRAHLGCHRWWFNNCISDNVSHYGMQWEGFNVYINNCQFISSNSTNTLYGFTDLVGLPTDPSRTIHVTNSRFFGKTYSFYLQGNVKAHLVGNEFTGSHLLVTSDKIEKFICKNNTFSNTSTRSIQFIDCGENGDTLIVKDNVFEYADTAGTYAPAVVIQSTGHVNNQLNVIVQGNVVPETATSVLAYAHRTGGILKISDNFAGSEIIDYVVPEALEAKPHTLTLTGSTSAPTVPVTHTNAPFTRIGNMVFFTALFSNVDTTGASGNMLVQGLPYRCIRRTLLPVSLGGVGFGGRTAPVAWIDINTTEIRFFAAGDGINTTQLSIPGAPSTTVFVSGCYQTDAEI
jgi:hypothetical protein